jgi:hypothetical protein
LLLVLLAVPAHAATEMAGSRVASVQSAPNAPASSSGCNGQICITVHGTGLHVDWIFTSADNNFNFPVTGHSYVTRNGSVVKTWSTETIAAHGSTAHTWTVNANWRNGDVACAGFVGLSGLPCKTIHS